MRNQLGIALIVILAISITLVVSISSWGRYNCYYFGQRTGMDVDYSVFTGCYANTPQGWMQTINIRYIVKD